MHKLTRLAACLGLAAAPAALADPADPPSDGTDRGTLTFVWENDAFTGSDQNYTNGVRLGYLSPPRPAAGIDRFVAETLTGDGDSARIRRGFAIGHSIFTPREIDQPVAPPDQHPYAGYLYAEATSLIETDNSVYQVALRLGQIGPSAGGEWLQREFHSLIGAQDALGWDAQLPDEFGADLVFDRRYRALATYGSTDLGADITPNMGLTLGTLNTNARAGLTVRLGDDLKNDFGPPRVRPSLAGAGFFNPDDGFSWYLFAGAEARYVAHDYILDGSLFDDEDTRTVTSKSVVYDVQAGVVMQLRGIQLGLTFVERSRQFEEQASPQQFAAVSWAVKF